MMTDDRDRPDVDGPRFLENRNRFPAEELAKYAGRYVAWNLDGTRILAAGRDHDDLEQKLMAAGINPSRVVQSYIEPLDDPAIL